jgi:hypothetical protein
MAHEAVPCPFAKEIDARALYATTQRVLCALPLTALAEADLRLLTRTDEPKDQECRFAKRTHLKHVKCAACISQRERKQQGKGRSDLNIKSERGEDVYITGMMIAITCDMKRQCS